MDPEGSSKSSSSGLISAEPFLLVSDFFLNTKTTMIITIKTTITMGTATTTGSKSSDFSARNTSPIVVEVPEHYYLKKAEDSC
eukprot:m.450 g.450  ORF g.450 m.450 type:complete len:83 (+) comp213_c1_seq1:376-624(+)